MVTRIDVFVDALEFSKLAVRLMAPRVSCALPSFWARRPSFGVLNRTTQTLSATMALPWTALANPHCGLNELVERQIFCRLVDATLERVYGFEIASLDA